jgi:5-methylcytosine-specific restriction endonuclease McrA
VRTEPNEIPWEDAAPAEHEADETYISDATRREVYERDGWKCRNCGEDDVGALTCHHVVYRSQGGKHGKDNLVTVCWACHRLIHDKVLTVVRKAGRWFFGDRRHWRFGRKRRR